MDIPYPRRQLPTVQRVDARTWHRAWAPLVLPRSDVPVLALVVGPSIQVSVDASDRADWIVTLTAEALADTQPAGKAQLDAVVLARFGSVVTVSGPPNGIVGELHIAAPVSAGIVIHAAASPVRVTGLAGSTHVSASRARVTLIDVSGVVDVCARVIDFCGDRGEVTLQGTTTISVRLSKPLFDGHLSADCVESIAVALPPAFTESLCAIVSDVTRFVCPQDYRDDFVCSESPELAYCVRPSGHKWSQATIRLHAERGSIGLTVAPPDSAMPTEP